MQHLASRGSAAASRLPVGVSGPHKACRLPSSAGAAPGTYPQQQQQQQQLASSSLGGLSAAQPCSPAPAPRAPPRSCQQRPFTTHRTSAAATTAAAPAASAGTSSSSSVGDNVPRGETAGAVLVLEDVTLQAGDRDLLEDVSYRLMPGQRVGLVGANGAGKTTLLKCICGLGSIGSGKLLISNGVSLGYLAQTAVSGSQQSLYQEARGAMTHLIAAEAAFAAAEAAAAAGDPAAAAALATAQEAVEAAGGYDAERRIGAVLDGLGFRREQWDWSCADFSGGWQMRIALARLLLSPAGQAAAAGTSALGKGAGSAGGTAGAGGGLLVLDEPTNHLDAAAIKWLAQFLASSGGSLVLVSHDEQLLEGACDRILEIRGRKLHSYSCGYSAFLKQREERAALAAATAASQAAEIARLEAFVARFGAKASKAAEAQSKMKLLEKLRKEAVEVPAAASGAGPGDSRKMTLRLPPAPPCYTDVLELKGVAVGWGPCPSAAAAAAGDAAAAAASPPQPSAGAAAGGGPSTQQPAAAADAAKPVVSGVSLTIRKGQRVLVLGPNGAGKSTLLKAMGGRLQPWEGSVRQGQGVKLSVFNQDLAQELPLEMTALDYVSEQARQVDAAITLERCRQALGALGLTGSLPLQTIGSLSGGEKARVALAVFALVPANVLLLDEASNHLDAATLEVLTGALQGFEGAIVAITHNPAFASNLRPTHVLRVGGGTAKLSEHSGPLSSSDFEHTSSSSSSKGAGKGKQAATNGSGKSKKGKEATKVSVTNGSSSTTTSTTTGTSSSKNPAKKRTMLSYSEQIQYKKLTDELAALNSQKEDLELQVSRLAQSAGSAEGLQQLEAASMQLAEVAGLIEEKELEWLELAELAGDL